MSDLRFHLERRTDGKWAPPQKQRTTGLMFCTGKKVEVSFEKENYRDVWFPATVLEDSGNDSFFVEYQSPGIGDEEPGLFKKIVDSLHIRPSPPNLKDKNFVLLDKVDAFFDFGWWSGVITKELADSRYLVLFKHTNKERELNQSELRPHMEWRDGKWFSASRRQICSPEDGVKRITPLPNLFSTWHKDCLISSDNQGKHIKKTKQTSPDDDTHARPLRKLKEGNGAETSSYQEVCQLNTSPLDARSKAIPYGFGSPSTGINSSEQPMAAADQSIVKPRNFLQGEEVESNQFGGGGSSIQKGRRGRPPKLLAVRKQNREVAAHDKMIVKDEVGLPATGVKEKLVCGLPKQINNSSHMMKTPLVNKDTQNVSEGKAAGGFKKDCFTKEVQKKIIKSPSTNSMPDDQPLSTWFEGVRSQTTINGSNISPDKNVEESTEGGKGQKLAAAAGCKESEALPSEVQRLPFVKNIELWRAIESMDVIQRMPQKPHFRDLESCNEIYREGLAVACMVNFSSLVQSTAKLRLEDPRSKIEGKLKTLVELEGHGFDVKLVRDRLNELLLLKDRHEELQKQYKEEESEIMERILEKSEIEEKNDDMTKKLRELEETRALIMVKKEKKDSEIASLELRVEGINDAIRSLGHEFVEVLAAATDALS